MEHLALREVVVFLAAAGLLMPVVKRLRFSPVLGFLVVGLAVGPFGLARLADDYPWLRYVLITDVDGVRALAELGVVFLLFTIGLELSLERLWSMRRLVFGMGSLQIALTGAIIAAIAYGFGNAAPAAIVLGSCLALSSTAVVMQLLTEQGRFGSPVGRGAFAILLAQDMAVVPILFLVGVLGAQHTGSIGLAFAQALGAAVLAVLGILGVGRLVVRPLFQFVGSTRSPEMFMASALLIVIATAAAAHAAGLSAALGAFLVGLLLAETEYRHEIEVNIEPFKGLLLGLFFMSVGMGIDIAEVQAKPFWIVASVAGLFLVKTLVGAAVSVLFGFARGAALEIGLLLGQGGEFAFVVVGLAFGLGMVPAETAQFMLIVVSATMLLSPAAARVARELGNRLTADDGADAPEPSMDLTGHVVIVGYGRTGRLLAELLDRQQIAHVALDLDAKQVSAQRAEGAPVYFGDASRIGMLERVRLADAALLAVSMDDAQACEHVLRAARQVNSDVPIVARARDVEHGDRLMALGATDVVPEVVEAGLQMGLVMLEHVGLPNDAAREVIEQRRASVLPAESRS